MCGLRHKQDSMDPTLDKYTGSERTFQRQEQVRDASIGRYHATDYIARITHLRWYLPDKKQERVKIQNSRTQPETNIGEVRNPSQTFFPE